MVAAMRSFLLVWGFHSYGAGCGLAMFSIAAFHFLEKGLSCTAHRRNLKSSFKSKDT